MTAGADDLRGTHATVDDEYNAWGETGNKGHITREIKGTLPTRKIRRMFGVMGEQPGEHRNRQGAKWDEFKADIAERGIEHPIFITHDHGQQPQISEGNHRRDAAVELGLPHVPVTVRYFGNAQEHDHLFNDRRPNA